MRAVSDPESSVAPRRHPSSPHPSMGGGKRLAVTNVRRELLVEQRVTLRTLDEQLTEAGCPFA